MTISPSSSASSAVIGLGHEAVGALIRRWRDDPGSTYRTWFLRE
ncbi:hypothetical protein [Streptomyces sp. P17]|uniref:Uncharacterized protein n=1 Tax=Streptomyces zinciresistens K42 TaxID=700597 RepID=G2G5W0_9ACTN|nr:hypothetical protein [Streptomyces sp. P17]EGX61049.1 hypothetical protein SZN_04321 [Streptomyces zinciresistens K42]